LVVWNRTTSKMESLVHEGASASASAAEVASQSDVVITIVSDTPDVEAVVLGKGGVVEGAKPGSVVVDMSTISPSATRKIASVLSAKGIEMLDAPVSGGDTGAIAGTLSIMVGGRRETFDRVLPVFEAMGKTITHCGPSGSGQATKLVNQVIGALNLLAMCEGMTLAQKCGLDATTLLKAVSAGAAGSWILSNLGPRVAADDFAPGFMVKLQQKDLRLVMETANEVGVSLPGAMLVHQLLNAVQASGGGDLGTQALVTAIRKLADV
ncbi:MAG TPA: NAD(P)-dependent oxidoreductase, partial [Planctomycetota bacterium]|nr:NAD(P)-dependent oxidoreductase [Planctomycetota bacterium]